jgi:DHA1 family inner membrane transport protein
MDRKERMILILLACLNFTHILDFMIMMPLGNYLMPHFNISAQFFSLIVAAYPVTAFFSGLMAASFVDRYDRKKILVSAYIGFLVGTILCGLAPTAGLLMAARIATGLFGGLIGAQVLSIIADVFPYEKRGRAMSSIFLAFSVSSIFGVPFSLYLANLISWHAPFIFIGVVGIVVVPLLIRFIPSVSAHLSTRNGEKENLMDVFKSIFSQKNQLLALALTSISMLGHFMVIPFINPYMEFNVGFSKQETPLIYMVGGAFTLISSSFIGRLADKYGKFRIYRICLFLSIIPILIITNMPVLPLYVVLGIFGFWFMFSTGRNIPSQAMISTVVEPARRGQFMSVNSSIQQLSTGSAAIISGMIVTQSANGAIDHYEWVGYLSITILILSFFVARQLAKGQELV